MYAAKDAADHNFLSVHRWVQAECALAINAYSECVHIHVVY